MQMKLVTCFFLLCSFILLVKGQTDSPASLPARQGGPRDVEQAMKSLRDLRQRFEEHMKSAHPEEDSSSNPDRGMNHRLARLEGHITRLSSRMDSLLARRAAHETRMGPGPLRHETASSSGGVAPVAKASAELSSRRKRQIYYDGYDGYYGDGYHGGYGDYGYGHGGWYDGGHW